MGEVRPRDGRFQRRQRQDRRGIRSNADAIAAETTARVAGDMLVKLKEITVTSEIAQIDMDFSDIDLRSFSKLIIRPALACTDNVDYRLRFGSGEGTIFRHYVNREFASYLILRRGRARRCRDADAVPRRRLLLHHHPKADEHRRDRYGLRRTLRTSGDRRPQLARCIKPRPRSISQRAAV